MERPVVRDVRFFLAHTPGLVRHGWKPTRERANDPAFWDRAQHHLRQYSEAVAYPPNQVLLGNLIPDSLNDLPRPWFDHVNSESLHQGPHGELLSEEEFYGLLKMVDSFDFVWLEDGFASRVNALLRENPLVSSQDLRQISGTPFSKIEALLANGTDALPLTLRDGQVIGLVRRRSGEDASLAADILLENLAAKVTATMAMLSVLSASRTPPESLQYLIGSGEEAIGDRYNRGGGNMAKAIAEATGCLEATGCDIKAFCCAPVYAMIVAGTLISSGVFTNVAVVGGGSLAKLGMKAPGHLAKDMPILEDVLVGFAVLLGRDDGQSPFLRLDSVGRHTVGAGSAQQQIMEALVQRPLEQIGLRFGDIGKYATELHNPEITDTVGNGNVPQVNYRLLAALAARRGEIGPGNAERDRFVAEYGMTGFSPTQGHIASAIPYMGHALDNLKSGNYEYSMFLAKGSLFLGQMTQLSDGASFILETNRGSR